MTSSLKNAFRAAGVSRASVPHVNANGTAKRKYAPPADGHIVIPFHKLRPGSVFVPIEKMGKKFYRKLTDSKTGHVRHIGDRQWCITRDLFIKWSNARSSSLITGRDAIFSLHDWCIVKVS